MILDLEFSDISWLLTVSTLIFEGPMIYDLQWSIILIGIITD